MIRVTLSGWPIETNLLALSMHHIARWLVGGSVLRELAEIYRAPSPVSARDTGITSPILGLRAWQKERMRVRFSRGTWLLEGAAAGAAASCPATDRPRPALKTYRGASEAPDAAGGPSGALKSLSRQEDATLFMTLLALSS